MSGRPSCTVWLVIYAVHSVSIGEIVDQFVLVNRDGKKRKNDITIHVHDPLIIWPKINATNAIQKKQNKTQVMCTRTCITSSLERMQVKKKKKSDEWKGELEILRLIHTLLKIKYMINYTYIYCKNSLKKKQHVSSTGTEFELRVLCKSVTEEIFNTCPCTMESRRGDLVSKIEKSR